MKHILTLFAATLICACTAPIKKQITPPTTQGIHHVGLTVTNLERTALFFTKALGFKNIGGKPDYPSIFVSNGKVMVTLWQASKSTKIISFNRKNNIGLHHLALKVSSYNELEAMYQKLKSWPGVKFDFSPELMGKGPAKHMIFYEPGGIRLELVAANK